MIERLAGLNCAAPSAQVAESARHVTGSNRPADEQMRACVCVCHLFSLNSIIIILTYSFLNSLVFVIKSGMMLFWGAIRDVAVRVVAVGIIIDTPDS